MRLHLFLLLLAIGICVSVGIGQCQRDAAWRSRAERDEEAVVVYPGFVPGVLVRTPRNSSQLAHVNTVTFLPYSYGQRVPVLVGDAGKAYWDGYAAVETDYPLAPLVTFTLAGGCLLAAVGSCVWRWVRNRGRRVSGKTLIEDQITQTIRKVRLVR